MVISDTLTLSIESFAQGGDGIARHDNRVVFVPYTAPGDVVRCRITEVKKTFARAQCVGIITPSEQRVQPVCPHYFSPTETCTAWCGGCNAMHCSPDAQREQKEYFVRNAFERIGKIRDISFDGVVPSLTAWHYRNKVQLPIARTAQGALCAGFFIPKTHTVLPIHSCHVQSPVVQPIVNTFISCAEQHSLEPYNEITNSGTLRHIIVRTNLHGNALVIIVTTTRCNATMHAIAEELMSQHPTITGVVHNHNPKNTNVILGNVSTVCAGEGVLFESIGHIEYAISPSAFFQINTVQAYALYEGIASLCAFTGNERVIDVYCGSGGIGLYLASRVKAVIGIEENKHAIHDAEHNATHNTITNATYHAGAAEDCLQTIEMRADDVVILNPPRGGVDPRVIHHAAIAGPHRIVYVSCNPVTLARDAALLATKGYTLQCAYAYDMFPQTSLVETIAVFSKFPCAQ